MIWLVAGAALLVTGYVVEDAAVAIIGALLLIGASIALNKEGRIQ